MNGNSPDDLTGLLGLGVPGEVKVGQDGQLYQWTQTVDGLGNPVGFWRSLRRRLGRLVRRGLPLLRKYGQFIPGPYADLATRALETAQRTGIAGDGLGELYEAPDGSLYQVHGFGAEESTQGLRQEQLQGFLGLGSVGDVRHGPDGELYQWVEGVDGLGNPVGFWRGLKRLGRRLRPFLRRAIPFVSRVASFVPGYGTAIAAGLRTATPFLRQAGIAGQLGELYEAADGTVYQVAGADDGATVAEADTVDGLEEDELQGQPADHEMSGLEQGYLREADVSGLDAVVPDEGPQTRWHSPPTEQPALFRRLW